MPIITPSEGPAIAKPPTATPSARDRAIAKLMESAKPQSQEHPVPNPSKVSVEELGAVKAPTAQTPETAKEPNGQPNKGEAEAPKPAKTEEPPLSAQYAQLARKEKALRAQAQELKRQQEAFKAEQQAKATQAPAEPAIDQSKFVSKDDLLHNPWETLTKLGMTYDQLTQAALNGPKPEDIQARQEFDSLKAEIKALKDIQEKAAKAAAEQQTVSYQQAISQLKAETAQLVKSDPAFETIKATNSIDDVVTLIEKTYAEDKVLMSVEEAAKMVEDYLVEESLKLAKLSKIQEKLKPAAPAASPAKDATQQPQTKTLTNSVSSTRPLTARERALLAFEGKLNK